jgi:nucleotide-binding universal stress UspA family protein
MSGTILCGVNDTPEGRAAAQMAAALSTRLELRLVLAHVVHGLPRDAADSTVGRQLVEDGESSLAAIARETRPAGDVDLRVELGDRADLLAQIAAEEGADLIVLGSRTRGFRDGGLRCGLARELEAATPAPILIAPPQTRKRSMRRLAVAEASAAR